VQTDQATANNDGGELTEDLRESSNAKGMDPKVNPPDPMPWVIIGLLAFPFIAI
jgi:hypothetical protein